MGRDTDELRTHFWVCGLLNNDPPTPHQDLRAAAATRHLQDAIGQGSANQLFVLVSVSLVERSAICGNQVCEAGERAPADINNLGGPS